ncbi:PREDICTED: non-structural maintenance of chromosomes element 1 homolog [Lupinus angustifolius]|uniref:non-structural maintenance of chromosomes element 1 homolog n=1 Tax=Lupinus angustifolius TaxID=3871 RepID=UPI00092E797A|nr:PREDICTED: non-structural maintenance of chromosomes element 1 homolog [Lupinus angustifolius]XP_019461771.1 PREDICTED: non-structural maintenance of chromosomes element 1 homolog [Lupinus angustifolius]XP_019461772.1 PREDICTED: non-structural maintenance of chromosomes element 1 homolog [Lupinus angustifolius]
MSGGLSWRHHTIIQALLSRGPLKEKDFHSMFQDLTKKNPVTERQLFDGFVLKINKALTCVHFELRGCIDQYDSQLYYGVVNTVSDEQSKLGTKYKVPQIAFYKAIIEAIVQDATANGVVSNIAALNFALDSQVTIVTNQQSQESQSHVPSALKNFSLADKEKTLHELVKDQWLDLTTDGNIKLGVKSFLDLRSWFRSNDVPSCYVCSEAGVKVELCQNENCTVRIHQHCLKQLFSLRKASKVCPSCATPWPYAFTKAEAVQIEDENEHRESQRATGSKEKKRRNNRIVEDGNAVQNEDDNERRGSQQATGSNEKRRRTNRIVEDANIGGSGASQPSSANFRRVTRSSAGLM